MLSYILLYGLFNISLLFAVLYVYSRYYKATYTYIAFIYYTSTEPNKLRIQYII